MQRYYLFWFIFVILNLFGIKEAMGQEAKVTSFDVDSYDLTAITSQRMDLNGNPCALIKVRVPVPGVTFEGNVIGEVGFDGSEYMAYVTAGTKNLRVKIPSHKPLTVNFASLGIDQIEGKIVYVLDIETASTTSKYPVRINIFPYEALITLDSEEYTVLDGKLEVMFEPGDYPYSVSANGYKNKMGILKVKNSSKNEIDIILTHKTEDSSASAKNDSRADTNTTKESSTESTSGQIAMFESPDRLTGNIGYQTSTNSSATNLNVKEQLELTLSALQASDNQKYNGHEWVDLGLPSGLKWATCNVGANSPEEYGDYFAWGETKPKKEFTQKNSETYDKKFKWLQKKGYIDTSGNLTMAHDAARQNWGGTWRMPTNAEIQELIDNTTTEWTTKNGVNGKLVTSKKNGNSIFFPATGNLLYTNLRCAETKGYCRSSTATDDIVGYGSFLIFDDFEFYLLMYTPDYIGLSVRPVTE